MFSIRKAQDRGVSKFSWLDSYHTFSFGRYYDPRHMGFGSLLVINDDIIAPGMGFGTHPHDNMEIVTYVLSGALEHKDSLGTGSVIYPGDVQRMSAGTGVTHSEFNPSKTEPTRLLQIWFIPDTQNRPPSYEQKQFSSENKRAKLLLVGSKTGRDGSVTIGQDVDMFAGLVNGNDAITHTLRSNRKAWVHVAQGSVLFNGTELHDGDGVAVQDEILTFKDGKNAEILVFDMG